MAALSPQSRRERFERCFERNYADIARRVVANADRAQRRRARLTLRLSAEPPPAPKDGPIERVVSTGVVTETVEYRDPNTSQAIERPATAVKAPEGPLPPELTERP